MSETSAEPEEREAEASGFLVSLGNFAGPFDLLLSLITKHELDITEVSLSTITDEFISYLKGLDSEEELDQASEFLVVAATLLDLKVAGLLPQGELVDAEDVALLEARDLLFARLLQYRAFKEAALWFSGHLDAEATRHVRSVRLEEKYRKQSPELKWTLSVEDFAAIAALAFAPREIPSVGLDHLHAPLVSIREQAAHVVALLRSGETMSFRLFNVRNSRTTKDNWDKASVENYSYYTDTTMKPQETYDLDGWAILETVLCNNLDECKGKDKGGVIPVGKNKNPPARATSPCLPGKFMYYGWEDRPPGRGDSDRDYDDIRVIIECPVEIISGEQIVRLIR